jgi:hypothetical protein
MSWSNRLRVVVTRFLTEQSASFEVVEIERIERDESLLSNVVMFHTVVEWCRGVHLESRLELPKCKNPAILVWDNPVLSWTQSSGSASCLVGIESGYWSIRKF